MEHKVYSGGAYARAVREFNWFDKEPDRISPVELLEWAITCGEWELYEEAGGALNWRGPWGSPPFIGSERAVFKDRNIAINCMRQQYESWWNRRSMFNNAFATLQAVSNAKSQGDMDDDIEEDDNEDDD